MTHAQIVYSLQFETQEEANAWKSAVEVGISYALGDSEACIKISLLSILQFSYVKICLLVLLASTGDGVISDKKMR